MSHLDTSNPFQSFILSEQEEEMATAVTPYTLMYLQNKLAAYSAAALSQGDLDEVNLSPEAQSIFVAKQIKSRAQIAILKELIDEFTEGANAALAKQARAQQTDTEN